jgi:hypothetical protein
MNHHVASVSSSHLRQFNLEATYPHLYMYNQIGLKNIVKAFVLLETTWVMSVKRIEFWQKDILPYCQIWDTYINSKPRWWKFSQILRAKIWKCNKTPQQHCLICWKFQIGKYEIIIIVVSINDFIFILFFQFSDVASLASIPRWINHQMVIGF